MNTFDRRHFLGATAGVATSLSGIRELAAAERPAEASGPPPAPPIVPLGNTGVRLSRIAQGTGVNGGDRQSDQTRMGFKKLVPLFRHAFDRGINFFDLADLYGTHIYFREALRSLPRDEVKILTKIWWQYDGPQDGSATREPHRAQACRTTLERFRHELTTDYLDIVLLHCVTSETWDHDLELYRDVLSEAQQKGQVGVVGCSCHSLVALKTAATCPWVEVILARINPKGVIMDGTPEEIMAVLRTARKNGKAVIGMKILGAGRLSEEREECVRFAQESGLLDAMTIGFHRPEQIDDMLRMIDRYAAKPLV